MTLGCLRGLMRKARERLVSRTKVACMISNGKAKLRGLSPCHAPSDEVLMLVMLGGNMILNTCILVLKANAGDVWGFIDERFGVLPYFW